MAYSLSPNRIASGGGILVAPIKGAPCFLANDADALNAFDWIKQAVEA